MAQTVEDIKTQLEKVQTSLENHAEQYRSGKTNTARAYRLVAARARQKLELLERLRTLEATEPSFG